MSVEQAVLEALRSLPPDKQQEILTHATRLRDEAAPKKHYHEFFRWADEFRAARGDKTPAIRRVAGMDKHLG